MSATHDEDKLQVVDNGELTLRGGGLPEVLWSL